jgi:hypothetical protein
MRGVSVICRMVRMGVLSITLCSSSLTPCSACSVRMFLIFDWSSLMSHCPLEVALAMAVDLAYSLVYAFDSAGEIVWWNLRCNMPKFLEGSTGHSSSGPWMAPGTICPHCAMPMILWCCCLCRQQLCIPTGQGDIGSNHTGHQVLH